MNPTYHIFAQGIIELQNLSLGLQNIQLPLICGLQAVLWLSFFLARWVYTYEYLVLMKYTELQPLNVSCFIKILFGDLY